MQNNIVIIGFGKQGQEYFESIEKLSNITIKAIVDSSFYEENHLEKARLKVREDIVILDKVEDLKEYENCTAIICIPHKYHFEITKNCIKKGFNIIKEKPLDYSYLNAK
jgi:predicted dehydrogenase